MNDDKEAFAMTFTLLLIVLFIAIAIYQYMGFSLTEIKEAQLVCKNAGTALEKIYYDGDFTCKNGALFKQ